MPSLPDSQNRRNKETLQNVIYLIKKLNGIPVLEPG